MVINKLQKMLLMRIYQVKIPQ